MKLWGKVALTILSLAVLGCVEETSGPIASPTHIEAAASVPPLTATAEPTATSTATTAPGDSETLTRCLQAPPELARQLSWGLVADGGIDISDIYTVKNNDERPWTFITGQVTAPGVEETMAWATASLDLDNNPFIVAVDSVSEAFSVWSMPGGERFAGKFDDDIRAAKRCSEG